MTELFEAKNAAWILLIRVEGEGEGFSCPGTEVLGSMVRINGL